MIIQENLSSLYWIPKLTKTPYKKRYIAGSSKCSTKHLSKVLTTILSTVKDGLQKYCDEIYSTSGVNRMCNLKKLKIYCKMYITNSTFRLLIFLRFTLLFSMLNWKIDFTISLNRVFSISMEIVDTNFLIWVVINNNSYFVKNHTKFSRKYTEGDDVIKMLDFLIDNVFV